MRNPDALIPYLEEREAWAFGYDRAPREHDCVRFADGGVEAVTGVSPLARIKGSWTNERAARRVLARYGGMARAVGSVMTEITPARAQRGDVGLTMDGALVLFEGQTVVAVSPAGLLRLPRAAAIAAWTVD